VGNDLTMNELRNGANWARAAEVSRPHRKAYGASENAPLSDGQTLTKLGTNAHVQEHDARETVLMLAEKLTDSEAKVTTRRSMQR